MKDLYKLAGLDRFEADPEIILAAARACDNPTDQRVIERILCDPQRKSEYDQALRTADLLVDTEQQLKKDAVDSGADSEAFSNPEGSGMAGHGAIRNEKSCRLLIVYGLVFALLFAVSFLKSLKQEEAVLDETAAIEPSEPSKESSTETVEIIAGPVTRHSYYVTAETLNVRKGPGTHNPVVGQQQRFADMQLELPATINGWARVVSEDGMRGYVSLDFVERGSGKAAYRNHCMESVSRPPSGIIFFSPGSGNQTLRIEAPPEYDVSARLVDSSGDTALMGYIRAGEGVSFEGVPVGRFQLLVGMGNRFSTECGLFTETLAEKAYDTPLVFHPSLSRSLDADYQLTISFSRLP